jgi:streptogramin lyase
MKLLNALRLWLLLGIVLPAAALGQESTATVTEVGERIVLEGVTFLAIGEGSAWMWNGVDGTVGQVDLAAGIPTGTKIPLDMEAMTGSVESGSLWVLSRTVDTIVRIDLASGDVVAFIDISAYFEEWEPAALVTGEGTVWVRGQFAVLQIDPAANQVSGEPVPAGEEILSAGIADGELWVGSHDDGLITRIDLGTRRITAQFDIGFSVHGLAVDDESAWVLDEHGFGVVRIDPATNAIAFRTTIDFVGANLAVTDGGVWVAPAARDSGVALGNDAYVRIDTGAQAVVETIHVGDHESRRDGYYLALTEDGESWAVIFGDTQTTLVRLSRTR